MKKIKNRINTFDNLEPPYKFELNLEYRFVIAASDEKVREYMKEVYKEKDVWRVSYCRYKENIIEL